MQMRRHYTGTHERRPTMADTKNYSGGCHCGQVRFDVTADLTQVITCNCSICSKRGAMWSAVTAEQFALRAGVDALVDYQFNKKVVHHLFCGECGVSSFSRGQKPDGTEMVMVNVRCLDGVDCSTLSPMRFDGKSL
jgi:hypothetical protein